MKPTRKELEAEIEELREEVERLEEQLDTIATDYFQLTGEALVEAICRMQDEQGV